MMGATKHMLWDRMKKLLFAALLFIVAPVSAYAACNPTVSSDPVYRGQNITFEANCDTTPSTSYVWSVFGQNYDTSPNPTLTLAVPATAAGVQTATLANRGQSVDYSTSFTVAATAPVSISPRAITFGATGIGYNSNIDVSIGNLIRSSVAINEVVVTGLHQADYVIKQNNCSTLQEFFSCRVLLNFSPSALGVRSAQLQITDSFGSRSVVVIQGSGISLVPNGNLTITPSPMVLPAAQIGHSTEQEITFSNTLNAGVMFLGNSHSIQGANPGDFSITNKCVDTNPWQPNESCSDVVTFTPTALGTRTAIITFDLLLPDGTKAPKSITVSGEGVVRASNINAAPANLSFGQTKVLTSAQLTVKLRNTALVNQGVFRSIALSGTDFTAANDCTIVATEGNSASPATLKSKTATGLRKREALDGCTVTITFTPPVVGTRTAELTVIDGQGNTLLVPITGEGVNSVGLNEAQIRAIATQQITANLQSMQLGLQTQLSNVNKRLRYLRFQDSLPAFRQEIDLTLNGKNLPVPSGGGGACGASGGRDGAGAAGNREECREDYKGTQNGRWGAYIAGGVGVSENTLSGAKISTNGITVGSDYRFSGKSAAGAAFGAMKSSTDMSGEAGKQDATGYSFVGYASLAPTQASFVDIALTAGSGKFDLQRTEADGNTAVADTSGSGVGVSISAGLDWRDGGWAITPYLRAEYINSKVKGFSERGNLPIQVGNQSMTSSMFSIGAESQYTASTSWGIFIPHARIEMQQQSQSAPNATAQAVGSSVQLTVSPDLNKDKSFGNAALGVSAQFGKGKTGFLDLEKTFGKDNFRDQRITTGLKVEF